MVDFKKLLVKACPSGFYFLSQRKVIFRGPYGYCCSDVSYRLDKDDVVRCINSFIQRIRLYSDKPIRGEGLLFSAFKMSDLVPYFYTLMNLYIHVRCSESFEYVRSLPELKLTRFCHLPFEEEITEQLPVLRVKYAILPFPDDENKDKYVCLSRVGIICVDSFGALKAELARIYCGLRVVLWCDLPF